MKQRQRYYIHGKCIPLKMVTFSGAKYHIEGQRRVYDVALQTVDINFEITVDWLRFHFQKSIVFSRRSPIFRLKWEKPTLIY